MAELPSYFETFLQEIRPTKPQREEMRSGYTTLRQRLRAFAGLSDIYVSDFLQGSYRRATAIRPAEGQRSDVDLVVVTNLDAGSVEPAEALERFEPFVEHHYKGKWKRHGRSIGIDLSYVELDLVVTAAPSEAAQDAARWDAVRTLRSVEEVEDWRLNSFWVAPENRDELTATLRLLEAAAAAEWKSEPLLIPDREVEEWQETHPLAQIEWTYGKNRATNRHYVNVVKAIKWWWRRQHPDVEHPKGYPLEHLVGDNCPDGIETVADGVTRSLEELRDAVGRALAAGRVPESKDRGTDQNVLKRLSTSDFEKFHQRVSGAAALARRALDEGDARVSASLWRELFGSKFPEPPKSGGQGGDGGSGSVVGGYSERKGPSEVGKGRFA